MVRLIGIIAVTASSVMTGIFMSKELKGRVELLKEIHQSAIYIRSDLEYRAPTLEECFKDRGELFSKAYEFINESSVMPEAALKKACETLGFLNREEKELIFSFAENLSKEDVTSQIANVEWFTAGIEERIKNAENEYATKGRLYRTGGMLAGMGILIFLL